MLQWLSLTAAAQPVLVTLKLDQSQIAVGGTATLHVLAQIAPAARAPADRIFSWYVDLLNLNGGIASADYGALQRPASDKEAQTSSTGHTEEANRLGIYDAFLNLPGAGRDAPVELFSIPLKAMAPGRATFHIRAGTGVSLLSADFLVAATGGGEPLVGGDYNAATIELEVTGAGATPCSPTIGITRVTTSKF